jgi:hypothetical protein
VSYSSDKGLISIKYKEFQKLSTQHIINGKLKHKEMLNILSYKGNANQNDIDIASPTNQNGFHQGNKQYQMMVTVCVCVGGTLFHC